MSRIVADTNIYVSALNFAGTADEVLALGRAGLVELCISPAILDLAARLKTLSIWLYIDMYIEGSLMTQLTISEARKMLLDLPEKLARTSERAVTITRRGQPVLAILPWEFYESILETLDILGDPEMVTALRTSLDDLKRGRLVSNAEAKKRLGV